MTCGKRKAQRRKEERRSCEFNLIDVEKVKKEMGRKKSNLLEESCLPVGDRVFEHKGQDSHEDPDHIHDFGQRDTIKRSQTVLYMLAQLAHTLRR